MHTKHTHFSHVSDVTRMKILIAHEILVRHFHRLDFVVSSLASSEVKGHRIALCSHMIDT